MSLSKCPQCGWVHPDPAHVAITAQLRIAWIKKHVCAVFGVSEEEITGKSRARRLVEPRQLVAAIARFSTKMSFEEIGSHLGGRDHTTMIWAAEQTRMKFKQDKQFREIVTANFPEYAKSLETKGAA